ncbi:MmgE/PrpD family protein [Bordetella sp. BOR01]|uniref:MmgE/PrpD family protein n=1 Tax=Bordetella sp. BOR01 TaxID=2854779 RepID=UPI001C461608|nr:MmgE/PrpD family protein [Bordetella sp. BOR01]MBV7484579.1 MmgE/PrpD family protein [Bordetella sp. BOR01]
MGPVLNPDPAADAAARQAAADAFAACVRRVVAAQWQDLAAPVRRRAAMIVADDVSAAFSALDEPQVAQARQVMLARPPQGGASLLAPHAPGVGPYAAATQNALAMGWNELDEGYRKAVCHGGLYVLPALMATAEQERASASDVLHALVLAYELVTRVARAWRFTPMRIHPHALLAPVGAAAGVAILRRLPPDTVLSAVAGACSMGMAGPFNQALQGVLVRNAWAAQGAAMGMLAVEQAQAGIGGSACTPYDVYVTALGAATDLAAFHDEGEWAVAYGYQKINACCQYAHSAIEAVQALIAGDASLLGGDRVTAIRVLAHPLAHGLDNREPTTTLGAKFSLPHAVAAAVVHGHGGATAFDSASLADPRIARLRRLVSLQPFPDPRPWPLDRPATVALETADGTLEQTCWSARGGPDQPFDDQDVWSKIESLCRGQAPQAPRVLHALVDMAAGQAQVPPGVPPLHGPWHEWMQALTAA